jgi:hypothetical protein
MAVIETGVAERVDWVLVQEPVKNSSTRLPKFGLVWPGENDVHNLSAIRSSFGGSRCVTGVRREHVGWENTEYYLYNLNDYTRVEE